MDAYREQSIIIGILYILVFVAGIFSVSNVVDNSDYLTKSASNSHHIYRAFSFQILMAIFYIVIVILLYSILKNYNEDLAIGFLGLRVLAVAFVIIGAIILLLILKESQEYIKNPNSETGSYSTIGNQLKRYRDLINHVGMIISLSLGSIALYIILFQSGLIPSWMSIWGIVGATIAIFASIFVATKYLEVKNTMYMILNIPIALQEIAFAIWLISKGLRIT